MTGVGGVLEGLGKDNLGVYGCEIEGGMGYFLVLVLFVEFGGCGWRTGGCGCYVGELKLLGNCSST